jgi:hypothetical protein
VPFDSDRDQRPDQCHAQQKRAKPVDRPLQPQRQPDGGQHDEPEQVGMSETGVQRRLQRGGIERPGPAATDVEGGL